MTRGPKPGSRNAYVYLANNGPQAGEDLPNSPQASDKDAGVRKFNLKANHNGGSVNGGGNKAAVYYIEGKHTPESVVRAWKDANELTVERVSGWALNQRAPEKFRSAIREVIGFEREFGGGGGDKESRACPFCDKEVKRLPNHLPVCEKKP